MHAKMMEIYVAGWETQIQLHSLILPLHCHRARLGDQELINRDILAALFSMSTVLDSPERCFSG
jgi:hypothetical protein